VQLGGVLAGQVLGLDEAGLEHPYGEGAGAYWGPHTFRNSDLAVYLRKLTVSSRLVA
jgi:hypothetical protein